MMRKCAGIVDPGDYYFLRRINSVLRMTSSKENDEIYWTESGEDGRGISENLKTGSDY